MSYYLCSGLGWESWSPSCEASALISHSSSLGYFCFIQCHCLMVLKDSDLNRIWQTKISTLMVWFANCMIILMYIWDKTNKDQHYNDLQIVRYCLFADGLRQIKIANCLCLCVLKNCFKWNMTNKDHYQNSLVGYTILLCLLVVSVMRKIKANIIGLICSLYSITEEDEGRYICTATSETGTARDYAFLRITRMWSFLVLDQFLCFQPYTWIIGLHYLIRPLQESLFYSLASKYWVNKIRAFIWKFEFLFFYTGWIS